MSNICFFLHFFKNRALFKNKCWFFKIFLLQKSLHSLDWILIKNTYFVEEIELFQQENKFKLKGCWMIYFEAWMEGWKDTADSTNILDTVKVFTLGYQKTIR